MSSYTQSVLFPRDLFTKRQAESWLKKHKYVVTKVDPTENYYRYHQRPPYSNRYYRIITLRNNVKLVIAF